MFTPRTPPTGAQLREARQWHGWNQTDLANAMGSNQKTVSRWELGGPPLVRCALLFKVLPELEQVMRRDLAGAELASAS